MDTVVNRLIRYAKVFSESDYYGQSGTPSNPAEFDMANLLVEELHGLGIDNAFVDETCYVYATIPATPGCEHLPAIGLIAHMDTTPDLTGKDVKPQIIHYEGGDIVLNQELNIVMEAARFPELAKFVGQDLVCTDGTTLLGADDKAGVAIILQAVEELLAEKAPHGKDSARTLPTPWTAAISRTLSTRRSTPPWRTSPSTASASIPARPRTR